MGSVFKSQRDVVNSSSNTQREVVKHVNRNVEKTTPDVVPVVHISQHNDVVHNSNNITINNSIIENGKEMTKRYATMLDEVMGTRGSWRWDMRQEAMAEDIARMGITVDQFTDTVEKILKHKRKEGIQPPYTLSYFKAVFTEDKPVSNVKDITKALTRSFKL